MDIEIIRKLIKEHRARHTKYIRQCKEAQRYYENDNDILYISAKSKSENTVRNADNRVSRNYHGLLINQKAAYLMTAPPLFDVGKKEVNQQIAEILGDEYPKYCKDLCVTAANKGTAWIHYWIDDIDGFQYAVMESEQIIPIYSNKLKKKLEAVLRNYTDIDESGKKIAIWEYWTDAECYVFMQRGNSSSITDLESHTIFNDLEDSANRTNVYKHCFGEVPFIPFRNNNIGTDDLQNIKRLIDAYDKVFSGFLNDLEDIQEVIFVLTNYGGEDLGEFLKDLKDFKVIKVEKESNAEGIKDESGIQTLNIEIPIEARKEFLEITRKAIFEQGQGVDPNPEKFGNTSGEALKFLYSLLELKAGFTETEFKLGFGRLVRAICRYLGTDHADMDTYCCYK